jgi:ppGpp synthetase/RelA/SpoT-type nucleotidyltranferase
VDPRAGYRAVHVITKTDGIPVEVQFRTDLQNKWAQVFERLADECGRQIC